MGSGSDLRGGDDEAYGKRGLCEGCCLSVGLLLVPVDIKVLGLKVLWGDDV